jgi:hypothetical protein
MCSPKGMSQLKPMIIVLLMLTSALAGCTGTDGAEGIQGPQGETGERGPPGIQGENGPASTDGQDGTDGMDADESRIAELEVELLDKDATIVILLGNISDMEEELDAVDNVIEMYYMMFVQMQNQITILQVSLEESINDSRAINDFSYLNFENAQLAGSIFQGSIWDFADLRNASLTYADFSGSSFVYAQMSGADG